MKLDISYLNWDHLYDNPFLEWLPVIDAKTGELNPIHRNKYGRKKLRPDYFAEYQSLTFEAYNTKEYADHDIKLYLSGSLHYLSNDGNHNANSYTIESHNRVVDLLVKNFNVIPDKTDIRSMEIFALIFNSPYDVDTIIKNTLFHQVKGAKSKQYNFEEHNTPSVFKVMYRKHYRCKEYNKGKHFGIEDIFKFELNVNRMKIINDIGVRTLSDLVNPQKTEQLNQLLTDKWNETFLYDWTIDKSKLTKKQVIKLKDYRNPNYWMDLATKRNRLSPERSKFERIVKENSQNVHQYIHDEIAKTYCNFHLSLESEKYCNFPYSIASSCIISKSNQPKKKYNKRTDNERPPSDKYVAHKVRNDCSNPRNNLKRSILKIVEQPLLFPINEVVTLSQEQINMLDYWKGTDYDILNRHQSNNQGQA